MQRTIATTSLLLFTSLGAALTTTSCSSSESPSAAPVVVQDGWQIHGAAFDAAAPQPLAEALARPAGDVVVVEGDVVKVCQASGCWLDLSSGGASVRVHFENADGSKYHLPKDGAGGKVVVQARIEGEGAERELVASGARFKPVSG
jgi:hypothetical protein